MDMQEEIHLELELEPEPDWIRMQDERLTPEEDEIITPDENESINLDDFEWLPGEQDNDYMMGISVWQDDVKPPSSDGSITPDYFKWLRRQVEIMYFHGSDDLRFKKLLLDTEFLEWCCLLEIWSQIDANEDDEISIGAPELLELKLIWSKEFTSSVSDLIEYMEENNETPAVDSVMLELEVKILQSKQRIEGLYRDSIQSSMMQRKSVSLEKMLQLVGWMDEYVELFLVSKKIDETVPCEKQIYIVRDKVDFLNGKLLRDARFLLHFRNIVGNFAGNFADSVSWLTCMYWAKEYDIDETMSDIILFDMLQKFIPYAYDITPLYFGGGGGNGGGGGVLKAVDLRLVSGFFLLGIENFVDFFFEHLATVLKDDFLFLRDRLLLLFTFLTDLPSCENAEGEEDASKELIRSQIHAILKEDAYLLLSFDEMKKDHISGKKALFSAFMSRIDIAIAKIRQLYYGSSDFWMEKMECYYLVSIQRDLYSIEIIHAAADRGPELQSFRMELSFLRVFIVWLVTLLDDIDEEEIKVILTFIRGIWCENEDEGPLTHRLHALIRKEGSIDSDWHTLASVLQGKIRLSKLEIGAWCVNLFHSSPYQFKALTSDKILKFLDSILGNLNDLVVSKANEIVPFKKQIETLEEKLIFLKNFLKLAVNCNHYKELGEFEMFVQAFAYDAALLMFLFWAKDGTNAESESETNIILSHMFRKIKPASPKVAGLYFGALMAICVHRSDDSLMFSHTAFSFVQLFLEDLHVKDDDFHILQDNIVFLLTFLYDPPNQSTEDSISSRIDDLFWEGLYGLTPFVDDIEGGFSKKKVFLSDFMMKIEAINGDIRHIYGKFPDPSIYNFPTVISPQFLDFLIQNLRNLKDRMNSDRKYAPFASYTIAKIEEELASFCPLFVHIFNVKSEVNETWLEVVNVVHLAEHVIMSCISSWFLFDHPIWYHMAYLSHVFDEIKTVKAKLEKIKENNVDNADCLPESVGFITEPAKQVQPSEINEIFVGFEDEEEKITNMLIWGTKSLDIVSVVGMGGLGKSTLAKKVYDSKTVRQKFDVFASCSVTQNFNIRSLLLDIIRELKVAGDEILEKDNDDLAQKLWQSLSRRKYLILLDDIWSVSAWEKVEKSFPNDNIGSRVMFTTRSGEVAEKCKMDSSPHQLRFLTDVESWELLRKKVFGDGNSPQSLNEIGNQIAKNCKGLPLAIAVIGGLLARMEKSPSRWTEVAQRLAYYLSDQGCMEILELSYTYLPENLKPCLIYLAAFPEDQVISVSHVIMLWIVEGFVQESDTKSLEDVAKEYFHDLAHRSFIINVGARSSSGGIKTFRVHDLILNLCQTKCRDGNFFQLNHERMSSSSSDSTLINHYRVSTQKENDVSIADADADAVSLHSNARTIHVLSSYRDGRSSKLLLDKFKLVQVLDVGGIKWVIKDINELTSLIHLRHIDVILLEMNGNSIPSSISNLWNITSLKLVLGTHSTIRMPETLWRMKSLRYVKVPNCMLKFPDDDDDDNVSSEEQTMDKVVSFSKPVLYTGKDVKRLLQRLPNVRKLRCFLEVSPVYNDDHDEGSIETLDFYDRELETLMLTQWRHPAGREYVINFPPTLKKLTLEHFRLPLTTLSAIAGLECLEVLKLRYCSFEDQRLEMESLVFPELKFLQLFDKSLVEWNATDDSFPCLEQLELRCKRIKKLPSGFGEMPTLRRIAAHSSPETESWTLEIQEGLQESGIQLQLSFY